ncbi:MAG: hypothetical protein QM723_03730 [Myxococcaceae bacterium]
MNVPIEGPVVLTVRGQHKLKNTEAARVLHNDTAGSQAGIAAARALGDLSHKVFVPYGERSGAKPNELLFLDVWVSPDGIGQFFSNPHVNEQGANLFTQKEPTIWMSARGSFSFHLPAAANRNERYVGIIRAKLTSAEKAIEDFKKVTQANLKTSRLRGQLSHELYIKVPMPGDNGPLELLGIDVWCDAKGMMEQYANPEELKGIGASFAGPPDATIWEQAPGNWSEW